MELKGLERITSIINDFLSQFDCDASVDNDFSYYPNLNHITFSFVMSDTASKCFNAFVEEYFGDISADLFLWSLLHEVGHHETIDQWENEELENFILHKQFLQIAWGDIDPEFCNHSYFLIPDEYTATEWAANYMMAHTNEVNKFWNELRPAIINFYKLNEIEF